MNIDEAILAFGELTAGLVLESHHALERSADILLHEAQSEIGVYQTAIGPVEAWAELSEDRKAERLREGWTENDPLLASGRLQQSITKTVEQKAAAVGSPLDEAVWMEEGTEKVPARSFLLSSLLRKEDELGHEIDACIRKALR